jgi:pimeloyl-ACP methyl ester carboxylesterase
MFSRLPAFRAFFFIVTASECGGNTSLHTLTESTQPPVLIAVGDHDFVRLDHVLETFQLIPNAELAVIPDAGHFVLNAEQQKVLPAIEAFLDAPMTKVPFATTKTGYHPGETR